MQKEEWTRTMGCELKFLPQTKPADAEGRTDTDKTCRCRRKNGQGQNLPMQKKNGHGRNLPMQKEERTRTMGFELKFWPWTKPARTDTDETCRYGEEWTPNEELTQKEE